MGRVNINKLTCAQNRNHEEDNRFIIVDANDLII